MTDAPRLKKSESLEIRLPHPTKQAFMARCQADGRTASETLRSFIEQQIAPSPLVRPRRRLRYLALGGLATAVLAAAAAPSLARPAAAQSFDAIHLKRDGSLRASALVRLDRGGDGRVTRAEFTTARGATDRP